MARASRWVSSVTIGLGRRAVELLPGRVRKALDDRFFYAVFNVTRVTNDAYGWRPAQDSGGSGLDEAARPLRRG